MCISRLSKLIFLLLTEEESGENCHFRLRSISVYDRQLPRHISIPTILIRCVMLRKEWAKNGLIAIIVVIAFDKERFHNAVEIDIL